MPANWGIEMGRLRTSQHLLVEALSGRLALCSSYLLIEDEGVLLSTILINTLPQIG